MGLSLVLAGGAVPSCITASLIGTHQFSSQREKQRADLRMGSALPSP